MLPASLTIFLIRLLISPTLFGVIFFIFGTFLTRRPPKTINLTTGYRTNRSMLNQDTWTEANRFSAGLMTRMGIGCILLGIICALFIPSYIAQGIVTAVLSSIGAIALITKTENYLKSIFDDKGNRK